jgi:20S proteasome subunit beta 6
MQADIAALHKMLKARLQMYEHQNKRQMSTTAIAQMLSNTLYYKRFFPYYTFNVLGGLDEANVGCVFSYDAVGSFQRLTYSASGTGQTLVIPFLDNQVK